MNGNGTTATPNNVWDSLSGFVDTVGNLYLQRETLKAKTAAAPAGSAQVAPAPHNPFAGFWSSFPQNDTKTAPNASPLAAVFGAINPLWIVLLGALGLLLVFARK